MAALVRRKPIDRRTRLLIAAFEQGVNTIDRREVRRFRAEWARIVLADRAARMAGRFMMEGVR